jgi:hypothetical protein
LYEKRLSAKPYRSRVFREMWNSIVKNPSLPWFRLPVCRVPLVQSQPKQKIHQWAEGLPETVIVTSLSHTSQAAGQRGRSRAAQTS